MSVEITTAIQGRAFAAAVDAWESSLREQGVVIDDLAAYELLEAFVDAVRERPEDYGDDAPPEPKPN